MTPTLTAWIALPLLGAVIGYLTNRLAVKMIFRPIKPVRFLGLRIQGLMGRRQQDLAESIGNVVGSHLVQHDDVVRCFDKLDFGNLLTDVLGDAMQDKVRQLQSLPLIGGFLTEERVGEIRESLVDGILSHEDAIKARLESAVEEGLDVRGVVTDKVAAFPVERLETLVLEVAGVGQVGVLYLAG